ncbi:hypothetical protein MKR01_18380, partial [Klebsiella sp. K4-154]|nr:hypothetical protein [Klebsiella sp. K4-154]
QRMAEYLVLYNSKRPHKSLELMTPVDYILRESKNCNMWWTHTVAVLSFVSYTKDRKKLKNTFKKRY